MGYFDRAKRSAQRKSRDSDDGRVKNTPFPKPSEASLYGLPAGFEPKKRFGQNFLTDQSVLSHEAELLSCNDENVLEIGAGDARLSRKLYMQGPATLTLVEFDRGLAKHLRTIYSPYKEVKIIEGDVLEFIGALPQNGFPFTRVTGNIPYQISGPLFSRLAQCEFARGVFCVQKEVAERLAANPGSSDWGRLSVTVQLFFNVKITLPVGRNSFYPAPKVDSAIILLERKKTVPVLPENFGKILTSLFSHRRKTVANAIFDARDALSLDKENSRAIGKTIKYAERKVFTLTPVEWIELSSELSGKC